MRRNLGPRQGQGQQGKPVSFLRQYGGRSGIIGGEPGYRLLRLLGRAAANPPPEDPARADRLDALLGREAIDRLHGLVVVDFGCGTGEDAIELARRGAARVIGVDIRPELLEAGRAAAARAGLPDRAVFLPAVPEPVDAVISIDAFEHFADPAAVLAEMHRILKPGGRVYASFGPPWYHPLGGHLFSVFPWAHLLFTEAALIRWRADFRDDGATRFSEVSGGLNQMTIGQFEALAAASPLAVERIETVPIRPLRWLHHRLTREFTTAIVRAVLRRPA